MKRIIIIVILLVSLTLMTIGLDGMSSYADTTSDTETVRVWGNNRYDTSFSVAEELFRINGKFDNVVLAYGGNFPDALSGGYLTKIKNAPLLLVNPTEEERVLSYIRKYMNPSGTVYILGGAAVVSENYEKRVKTSGYNVKRLSGSGRYETNLAILNEIGGETDGLLIARGDVFADSLSASSAGKALLLVDKNKGITDEQIEYITSTGIKKFYIVGGVGAIPESVETQLKDYGTVERIAGVNRYETSVEIAKRFYDNVTVITLATGKNFPDGLSGSPLAMNYNSPILLVSNDGWEAAHNYVMERNIRMCVIVGGQNAISDTLAEMIISNKEYLPEGFARKYIFASGAGAWRTVITLNRDGTFEGVFSDWEAVSDNDTYKRGTYYYCEFTGAFTDCQKVNDYTWSVKVSDLVEKTKRDAVWIENDTRYIGSSSYGIVEGGMYYAYASGIPSEMLPDNGWLYNVVGIKNGEEGKSVERYIIFNNEKGYPFVSMD